MGWAAAGHSGHGGRLGGAGWSQGDSSGDRPTPWGLVDGTEALSQGSRGLPLLPLEARLGVLRPLAAATPPLATRGQLPACLGGWAAGPVSARACRVMAPFQAASWKE